MASSGPTIEHPELQVHRTTQKQKGPDTCQWTTRQDEVRTYSSTTCATTTQTRLNVSPADVQRK